MIEYHKIETPFKRAQDGTKKLTNEWNDETIRFLKDMPWEWTEKVNGTNIRIHWDGHRVYYGGRTELANIPANLMNYLLSVFSTNEAEELFEQKFGETEVIIFGEGYGPKIQSGGEYRDDVSFIMFDVMINGNYQPRESVNDIVKAFGVDAVPVLFTGTIDDAIAFVKTKPASVIRQPEHTAMMEGVVGRPVVELRNRCGKRIIQKVKVRDFA